MVPGHSESLTRTMAGMYRHTIAPAYGRGRAGASTQTWTATPVTWPSQGSPRVRAGGVGRRDTGIGMPEKGRVMSRLLALVSSLVLLLGVLPMTAAAVEPVRPHPPLPDAIAAAKLGKPITAPQLKDKVHTSLAKAHGPQRVVVRLSVAPSIDSAAAGAAAQATQLRRVKAQHRLFISHAKRIDAKARVLGETQRATNLVSLRIDASKLAKLAARSRRRLDQSGRRLPAGARRDRAVHRRRRRSRTLGATGKRRPRRRHRHGHRLHARAFGGPGTDAAYDAAYGTSNDDTAQRRPSTACCSRRPRSSAASTSSARAGRAMTAIERSADPGPRSTSTGHGTHVADIIGGKKGVAPGVKLLRPQGLLRGRDVVLRRRACSSAMDWAVDPNGDGITPTTSTS